MKVTGTRTEYGVSIDIKPLDVAKALLSHFDFKDNYFLEGGAIYEWVDEGYHKADYVKYIVTNDAEKVKQFRVVSDLIEILKKEQSK